MAKTTTLLKRSLLLLTAGTSFSFQGIAQCAFTPVISPTDIILCPNETDTIWTQVYDSYQWLQDGTPIPGATQQYFVVNYFEHAGSSFKVTATQAGCTETSGSVLVDGWAFLPPFVSTYGDAHICPGDTVILQLMSPYTESVQWYKNGWPIPDSDNDSLIITQPGNYTVEGAPAVCPNYIQPLGLDITISGPEQPVIQPSDLQLCNGTPDTLFISSHESQQWFVNGAPITGATSDMLLVNEAGDYYVIAQLAGCTLHSDTVAVANYITGAITISVAGSELVANISHPEINSFQWYLNGAPIPGANGQTYLPTASGSYSVVAQENNCVVTAAAFDYELPTAIGNLNAQGIRIYPNPTRDVLIVSSEEPLRLSVYDLTGKLLIQATAPGTLDVAQLPRGNYLLLAADAQGRVLLKQMINKQ